MTIRGVGFASVPGALPGTGSTGFASCRFGRSIVRAMRVSDLGLLCVTPPNLVSIVHVAIALNGLDFQHVPQIPTENAPAGSAAASSIATFEYLCSGYTEGPTCLADPSCGWCEHTMNADGRTHHPGSCVPCSDCHER